MQVSQIYATIAQFQTAGQRGFSTGREVRTVAIPSPGEEGQERFPKTNEGSWEGDPLS